MINIAVIFLVKTEPMHLDGLNFMAITFLIVCQY